MEMKNIKTQLAGIAVALTALANPFLAQAFEVKGRIQGLQPGETVYLLRSPEGKVEHKWSTTVTVDSCRVNEGGEIAFQVANRPFATLWTLKTRTQMLKYFFSADQDLHFEGSLASFGMHDCETLHGSQQVALHDVLAFFEDPSLNPVKQRLAVDYLKRHAADDITPWAASYFAHIDPYLSADEVDEILQLVPAPQQANPYYRSLRRWCDTLLKFRTGAPYTFPKLRTASHPSLPADFLQGHPVLLYSCNDPNIGRWYFEYARAYAQLAQEFPQLRVILLHPTFQKEEANQALAQLRSEHVCSLPYEAQTQLDPNTLNIRSGVGTLLLHPDGRIQSTSSQVDRLREALTKNYDPSRTYELNGYVEGCSEGVAELLVYRGEVPTRIDTATIENGHFRFYGQFHHPVVCYVGIRGHYEFADAFLENAPVQMHLWSEVAYFKGEKYRRVKGRVHNAPIACAFQEAASLETDVQVEDWLQHHRDSWAAFNRVALWTDIADPNVLDRWMQLLDPKFHSLPEYADFQHKIAQKRKITKGSLAPDFTLTDEQGQPFTLSSLRGKYVLLDFWASWCAPCRKAIPLLKSLHQQYHPRGLEVVSLSIDDYEKRWKEAVAQEQMPWTQLWRNKSAVDRTYFVSSIPHLVLIGPDGKILESQVRKEELQTILGNYLGE